MSIHPNDGIRISDVALPLDRFPVVGPQTMLKTVLEEMNRHRLGIACVTAEDGTLLGVFTDGDIRRQLLGIQKPFSAFFSDDIIEHAAKTPRVVASSETLLAALDLMERYQIWDLPVVDDGKLTGLLHLHPIVQAMMER